MADKGSPSRAPEDALPPTVAAVVRAQSAVSWSKARQLCADGRVTVDGVRCTDPAARVLPDAIVVVDPHGPKQRGGALPEGAIIHHDRDLVVFDKPAGMLSVEDVPGNKDHALLHVRTLLRKVGGGDAPLSVVHRLDRDTSGVMVFTRTIAAQKHLAIQFRDHTVDRAYLAIAHGEVAAARVDTQLLLDRGDGLRGSFGHYRRVRGEPPSDARQAITYLEPVEALRGATLVECRLETGRQHQIRIHLAELGHPLVGERVYIRDFQGRPIDSERTMLHARLLGFEHPTTGERVSFERPAPADFEAMLSKLR